LKAGIYHDSSRQQSYLNTGVVTAPAAGNKDRTAFLGEIGVAGQYALGESLLLRCGYNLIWLETVTLASDQIPATNLLTAEGIAADGGVFYHGVNVGLELRH
jgi:hypothetical protein